MKSFRENSVAVTRDHVASGRQDTADDSWKIGRRIVELGVLAAELSACKKCSCPLSLANTSNEIRYGLGSILHVRCTNQACNYMNNVFAGRRHSAKNGRKKIWDVNTKAAEGKKRYKDRPVPQPCCPAPSQTTTPTI